MTGVGLFASAAPYHLLAYGTLLGSDVFQTFINGVVGFRVLPRAEFSALQQQLFPIYFSMQTYIPMFLALTYPGSRSPFGSPSGLAGVVAKGNRLTVLTPLALMAVGGAINRFVVGPKTTQVIRERRALESKEGKKCTDPADQLSEEMRALNKKFGMLHGASSLINLITVIVSAGYGFKLAAKMH